jgi:hypothetical protein
MKRFSQQFKSKAEGVSLQAQERQQLRERLVSYMEYHPLSTHNNTTANSTKAPLAEPFRTVRIDLFNLGRFAGAFAVLAMVVVPIIAENTIPGDILYPVKVSFNEEVRGTLTLSPYQKVEWETERLERRIGEAQLLADAGLLTPEVEAEVAQAVKTHSDAAKKEIATLSESNAEQATFAQIALTSALEVQSEVLENKSVQTETAEGEVDISSLSVGKSILAIAVDEARVNTETVTTDGTPTPEKLLAHIESETTRAYEYLDSIEEVASVIERNDIGRRLSDINKKVAQASGAESAELDAQRLMLVLSDIRKLISFMTNIDVRANVSVEDLVPIVLTDEERLISFETNLLQVTNLQTGVNDRLPAIPSEIREKLDLSLLKVNDLKLTATTSIQAKDLDTAENAIAEALAMMLDIDNQTKIYQGTNIDLPVKPQATSSESVTEAVLGTSTQNTVTNI